MNSFSRIIVIQENGTAINVAREGKRGEDGSNNGGEARAFFVRAFIRSNRKSIDYRKSIIRIELQLVRVLYFVEEEE